ncbi:MAG: PIN domain-containing protein [Gemmatimonadaceae bacterium]
MSLIRQKLPRTRRRVASISPDELAMSSISAAELYHGAARRRDADRQISLIRELLISVRPLPFGSDAAIAYGFVRSLLERKGEDIGRFDMLIAAHALAEGATVVTHNTREFRRVPGLQVEDWND